MYWNEEVCGLQGEENEVDGRNTSQGNEDIKSTETVPIEIAKKSSTRMKTKH
jgi:hypothetical protein